MADFTLAGYGPGNAAFIIEVNAPDQEKATAEIGAILEKVGGRLANVSEVRPKFTEKGNINLQASDKTEDFLLDEFRAVGVDGVTKEGNSFELSCPTDKMEDVIAAVSKKYTILVSEIMLEPKEMVEVDEEAGRKLMDLMDELDAHENIESFVCNAAIPGSLFDQ